MRYTLTNGTPEKVLKITVNGLTVTNPSDGAVDASGAGYPLDRTDPPQTSEGETLSSRWELSDGRIVQVWTVHESDPIQAINAQIDALNTAYEAFKNTPILYEGSGYLPRWVPEYYTPILTLGESAFPMSVSAVDGSVKTFTFLDFKALFGFLVSVSAVETARVNGLIAGLEAQKAELEGV